MCSSDLGKSRGPSASAQDWLKYGDPLDDPRVGAITIVHHEPDKSTKSTTASGWHVAFYVGGKGNSLTLLGGNQSHAVKEKTYAGYWEVKGYRWPKEQADGHR